MRYLTSAAAAALLALAACSGEAANNSSEAANQSAAGGNEAAPTDMPAAPAGNSAEAAPSGGASATLSRDYVVGRWTNTGDCADAIEFRADGAMVGPFGEDARWELRGTDLFMVGNPDPLRVVVIDQRTMETTSSSGSKRRATRC